MKAFLPILLLLTMGVCFAEGFRRVEIPINQAWKFSKGDPANAFEIDFNDSTWENVCLPHTWNNFDGQDGGDDYYRGPAWYRKNIEIPEKFRDDKVFVRFGAAGMIADVYLNGRFVGEHRGGYSAFVFDITSFVHFGRRNLLAVKVDNTSPQASEKFRIPPLSADFTMDGGLYRSAELIITKRLHVSLLDYGSPGVFITPKVVSDTFAEVFVRTELTNDTKRDQDVHVKVSVYDKSAKLVVESVGNVALPAARGKDLVQHLKIQKPHLWDGRHDPYLYKVVVTLLQNNHPIDVVEQPLGLRYYEVDPERGFFLNGKPYRLYGASLHEDKKDEGRAITLQDRKQEMRYILDIGATMVRFAHYQYDQEMYRLCDENGIIVWTEIPLVNQIDSSISFEENAKQQLIELIRQNYNHPSVFFWGIFNEILNVRGPDPTRLVRELNSLAKKEDSTRLTAAAANMNDFPSAFVTDVLGLNKYFGWYEGEVQDLGPYLDKWHKKHPDRAIGLSEYGAGGSIFQHEESLQKPRTDGPWHPEEYQTYFHEVSWKTIESRHYIWFSTLWNMFDFASDGRREGFQPGINDKGIITQDHETEKDSYFWYKVNWRSAANQANAVPLVHINSKMFAARDTDIISVEVYSNADQVELFVNEELIGKVSSDDHIFVWRNVHLVEGSNHIKAVASINGKEYYDECWWRYDNK
jgi:beta-galactosidase